MPKLYIIYRLFPSPNKHTHTRRTTTITKILLSTSIHLINSYPVGRYISLHSMHPIPIQSLLPPSPQRRGIMSGSIRFATLFGFCMIYCCYKFLGIDRIETSRVELHISSSDSPPTPFRIPHHSVHFISHSLLRLTEQRKVHHP